MTRGVWWATVHKVTKIQTQLKWLSTDTQTSAISERPILHFIALGYSSVFSSKLYTEVCSVITLKIEAIGATCTTAGTLAFSKSTIPQKSLPEGFWSYTHAVELESESCWFLCHWFAKASSLSEFFSSVQFSHSVMSDSLWPHELQHARPPCPSPSPRVHSNSCPSSQWCHPAISSSVVPFSSCPQSLPASESFPISQLLTWGGQSIGVSALASFLPKNTRGRSPLGGTGWISLQSKGLSRVFSNTEHIICAG